MTKLEIILCCFSVAETVISAYFFINNKKKLDEAKKRYDTASADYEAAVSHLNIWINAK